MSNRKHEWEALVDRHGFNLKTLSSWCLVLRANIILTSPSNFRHANVLCLIANVYRLEAFSHVTRLLRAHIALQGVA